MARLLLWIQNGQRFDSGSRQPELVQPGGMCDTAAIQPDSLSDLMRRLFPTRMSNSKQPAIQDHPRVGWQTRNRAPLGVSSASCPDGRMKITICGP